MAEKKENNSKSKPKTKPKQEFIGWGIDQKKYDAARKPKPQPEK